MRRGDKPHSDTGTLAGDTFLFNVPDRHALIKILDKDYAVAGIPKVDDRGRTVDVHCLRHSFATWIGESGPPVPKTGGGDYEPVLQEQLTTTAAEVSATVSPKAQKVVAQSDSKPPRSGGHKRKSEPAAAEDNGSPDSAPSADFAAALAMIASLPLSDAEKAEAVRRLLLSHET